MQPLLLDWGTCTLLSDQTFPQKAELYKSNHIKPGFVNRLWYKAQSKLGLLFSVPWVNVMFLSSFLVPSVPQRGAVAILAVFPPGCSLWFVVHLQRCPGELCSCSTVERGKMLRLVQITRTTRPVIGCSCNSPEELIWDCAGMVKGNFSCSFLQEFTVLDGLCGISFLSSSLEYPKCVCGTAETQTISCGRASDLAA